MSERVLVIGAGFLGGNIAEKFKDHIITQTNLTKINKNSYILDITDEKQVVEKVTKNIVESLSTLIEKNLDLFSSKINQK